MTQCSHCFLDLNAHPPEQGGACPNCGRHLDRASDSSVAPIGPGASVVLLGRFWASLRDIIFRPTLFFSSQADSLISKGGLSTALAFAVIVQWIAAFFNFVWSSTVGVALQSRVDDLFRIAGEVMEGGPGVVESFDQLRSRMMEFFFGAGTIILTPFTTLAKLSILALFVHAAVRFFTKEAPGRSHSYATTLKVLAYSSAPWILCIIPGFGILLAWILAFSVAVIGLREVYRMGTGQAVLAVIFPELLFLALLFAGAVLLLFLAFNVMRLVF